MTLEELAALKQKCFRPVDIMESRTVVKYRDSTVLIHGVQKLPRYPFLNITLVVVTTPNWKVRYYNCVMIYKRQQKRSHLLLGITQQLVRKSLMTTGKIGGDV
ncbi:hypothetical protein KIN20_037559 [Parelaphostrongylus tenuis]|uniref:Uncharacterized protein n=1 Tax=Parelaphostrongylus tenuis TaxID=148309 RepID=A0AAD5WL92_PARTN|nr:hypothetical protein KIN20_037559 [Parelaphostrongylus tenuis]